MTTDPEHIGRYRIEAVLGRGGMGVVYKAHDPQIDRPVAVKLVRADLLDGEERADYVERLRREAQAAGRCTHPNIVALYDYSMHDGNPFLVMEYVRGMSLAQALTRGTRFRQDEAVFIVGQVLEGLGCAHGLGVVHRDVKPANILLVEDGRVKVTDFGLSRIGGSTLTQTGSLMGTPSYMSPEQCRGDEADYRSDLFSTGVVLHELLAGERPFPGRDVTVLIKQILYDEPPNLKGVVPDYLVAALRRALAKRPEDRFSSAASMAAALRPPRQATAEELTIVQPAPASLADQPGQAWVDEQVLTTLQRRLARHVGPIAKVLVSGAVRNAANPEALFELLAKNIANPDERQNFLREARREFSSAASSTRIPQPSRADAAAIPPTTGGSLPANPSAAIAQTSIDIAQIELARFIGPIARVLVKRALASCGTPAELWVTLAEHIQRPEDRAAFMRLQPRG
jgi:eukaryotic-like serine/threonine-protein kinase